VFSGKSITLYKGARDTKFLTNSTGEPKKNGEMRMVKRRPPVNIDTKFTLKDIFLELKKVAVTIDKRSIIPITKWRWIMKPKARRMRNRSEEFKEDSAKILLTLTVKRISRMNIKT
jgi:hypothetical protein